MTQIDDTPSGAIERESIRKFLGDTSGWPPGSVMVNLVGVAQLALPTGGTKVVRVYPCGAVNGQTERGMLADALSDSVYDRDRQRGRSD